MPSTDKDRNDKKKTPKPKARRNPKSDQPAVLRPTEDEMHFEHVLRRLVIARDKLGQK